MDTVRKEKNFHIKFKEGSGSVNCSLAIGVGGFKSPFHILMSLSAASLSCTQVCLQFEFTQDK